MSDIIPTSIAQVSNPFAKNTTSLATVHVESERAIAEVQAAMLLARRFPRDPVAAMDRILNACTRESLAEGALYSYSRGGSEISGPSIRLAEAVAQEWGNIRSGVVELSRGSKDGKTFSEAKAYSWNIETNTYEEKIFQVPHWRDTKGGGYPVKDERDIYELVANVGSRRKRACILAVIPGDVVERAVQQCEVTLQSSADTSPEAMQKMLKAFLDNFGITKEQIEKRIQRRIESIVAAQVISLRKIYASLKDGMSSPGDWFEGVSTESPDKPEIGKPEKRPAPPVDDEQRKKLIDAVNEARDAANLTMSDFKAKAFELGISQKGDILPNYTIEQLTKVKEQWASFSGNAWQE